MNTSGVTSATGVNTVQPGATGAWQQRKQSFEALSQALKSGDLGAAQQAFSSLSSSFPAGIANDPNSPLAKLGQALQSGNLSDAQSAFSALRSRHGGHHHHHDQDSASATATASPTGSVGGNVNVSA